MKEHVTLGGVLEPQPVTGLAERLARKSGAKNIVRPYAMRVYGRDIP